MDVTDMWEEKVLFYFEIFTILFFIFDSDLVYI